jgi:hypothetical protein
MKPLALIQGLALAIALAAPAPVLAAATPLQMQMATKMLEFIDFKTQVRRGMDSSTLPPELLGVRPDWKATFDAAVNDELEHDMPVIESMVGLALGKSFTDDELKVGVQIVSDANLRTIYLAAQNGSPPPQVQIAKATEDALATPAGQSFAGKLQTINDVLQPVLVEVTATLVPGTLRRFGEKAEVAEVQKRAAAGYAPAK